MRNYLVVAVLWAAIYLPALGSLEIKGEEGRRILPAVAMLASGNSVVPQIGSEPYLNKPPLINWLVAGSFKLFGVRNEWSARLPSALCVLIVALAFVLLGVRSLGPNGSLVAAIAWLTNFGLIEKGRLIEIEALYVSLTALAFVCWFAFFHEGRSPWLTWTIPWLFLGLGWLAKGPLHLVFFYSVVAAILYQHRELRQLWRPAHAVGLLLMAVIFAAWLVPYLQAVSGAGVAHNWSRQFSGRLAGEDFQFRGWILNIPRGLAYFLPWLIVLALARRVEFVDETQRRTVRALGYAITTSFLAISLIPGSLPRYTMPLIGPACVLVALLLCAERLDFPAWSRLRRPKDSPLRIPLAVAVVIAAGLMIYAVAIVPQLQHLQKVKTIARQIDAVVSPGATLDAVDPDYQPFLFYVQAPLRYRHQVADLPPDARFVLVRPAQRVQLESARPARAVLSIRDYRGQESTLYRVENN